MKLFLGQETVGILAVIGVLLPSVGIPAEAADFTAGNLVVARVGDGSAVLSTSASAVFLQEYTPSGSLVQTIALPTAVSGANLPFTLTGNTTSEGSLKLSADNLHLTLAGYGAVPGTASVAGTTSAAARRVVAVINTQGMVDTTTALLDAYSGSNVRSAVSTDGTNLWLGGNSTGTGGGIHYTTVGSIFSTQIVSSPENIRFVNIFGGQLYMTAASGSFNSVSTVGFGDPTTATVCTPLPGLPSVSGHSPYDFWFKDATTLYIADDGTAPNGGGVQKWTFDGVVWSLQYILFHGALSPACRGLTGTTDGSGNAVLYATLTAAPTALVVVTDTGSNSIPTTLASASANTVFRGVAFAPGLAVVQPPTLAITNLGGAVNVSWPASYSGWVLYENTSVGAGGSWTEVPPAQYQINGGTASFTLSAPAGTSFFRLQNF